MRLKVYLLIPFCLLACVGNVQQNKPKSNTTHQREPEKVNEEENSDFSVMFGDLTEREIDSTHIWNRIAESIYNISVPDLVHNPNAMELLEECKELNEEKKVRNTFSPMCHPGDTIYFICHLIIEKGNKYLAFWKKHKGRKTDFSDVKGYTYVYHKRKEDRKNAKINDSVVIFSNPSVNINIASEKIIRTCNRWDTVTLKTNKTLDGDDYEDSYRSAYRVILKKSGRFSIQYVKIVNQGHPIIRSPNCVR
jgi:hypothetical protein